MDDGKKYDPGEGGFLNKLPDVYESLIDSPYFRFFQNKNGEIIYVIDKLTGEVFSANG